MKRFALLLVFFLARVQLQHAEVTKGAIGQFVEVLLATLNTPKENWGGEHVTPEQCAAECLRRPNCASFEMEDTNCFLSENDSTVNAKIRPDWTRNYYQRIRPDQEWIVVKKVTIPSKDHLAILRHVNVSDCVKKCRENPFCKSFDFKESASKCDLSNVTQETHQLYPSQWGWDIYIFNPDYKPVKNCGQPPEIDHSSVKFNHTDYLAVAIYTFETGETYTMVCEENGKWGHADGFCKKHIDCGQPPLLGFAGVEFKKTSVNSTATYKCLLGERYPVVCDKDGSWAKPTGLCRNPRSCKEFRNCAKIVPDGEYWIYPNILNGSRLKVFCSGMSTNHPKEYVTLKKENFALSSPMRGYGLFCLKRTVLSRGRPGKTRYSKVRILPKTMVLDTGDFQYVSVINGYGWYKQTFATAVDCLFKAGDRCSSQGAFQVDLKGTGLTIDKSVKWKIFGFYSRIQFIKRSNNNQNVRGVCGGKCGGCKPDGPLKVNIFSDDQPNEISAKFCQKL